MPVSKTEYETMLEERAPSNGRRQVTAADLRELLFNLLESTVFPDELDSLVSQLTGPIAARLAQLEEAIAILGDGGQLIAPELVSAATIAPAAPVIGEDLTITEPLFGGVEPISVSRSITIDGDDMSEFLVDLTLSGTVIEPGLLVLEWTATGPGGRVTVERIEVFIGARVQIETSAAFDPAVPTEDQAVRLVPPLVSGSAPISIDLDPELGGDAVTLDGVALEPYAVGEDIFVDLPAGSAGETLFASWRATGPGLGNTTASEATAVIAAVTVEPTIVAPTVTGSLQDITVTQGGAPVAFDAGALVDDGGGTLAFTLPTPRAGVTIDSATGAGLVDPSVTGTLAAATVIVRATNEVGSVDLGFSLTVEAAFTEIAGRISTGTAQLAIGPVTGTDPAAIVGLKYLKVPAAGFAETTLVWYSMADATHEAYLSFTSLGEAFVSIYTRIDGTLQPVQTIYYQADPVQPNDDLVLGIVAEAGGTFRFYQSRNDALFTASSSVSIAAGTRFPLYNQVQKFFAKPVTSEGVFWFAFDTLPSMFADLASVNAAKASLVGAAGRRPSIDTLKTALGTPVYAVYGPASTITSHRGSAGGDFTLTGTITDYVPTAFSANLTLSTNRSARLNLPTRTASKVVVMAGSVKPMTGPLNGIRFIERNAATNSVRMSTEGYMQATFQYLQADGVTTSQYLLSSNNLVFALEDRISYLHVFDGNTGTATLHLRKNGAAPVAVPIANTVVGAACSFSGGYLIFRKSDRTIEGSGEAVMIGDALPEGFDPMAAMDTFFVDDGRIADPAIMNEALNTLTAIADTRNHTAADWNASVNRGSDGPFTSFVGSGTFTDVAPPAPADAGPVTAMTFTRTVEDSPAVVSPADFYTGADVPANLTIYSRPVGAKWDEAAKTLTFDPTKTGSLDKASYQFIDSTGNRFGGFATITQDDLSVLMPQTTIMAGDTAYYKLCGLNEEEAARCHIEWIFSGITGDFDYVGGLPPEWRKKGTAFGHQTCLSPDNAGTYGGEVTVTYPPSMNKAPRTIPIPTLTARAWSEIVSTIVVVDTTGTFSGAPAGTHTATSWLQARSIIASNGGGEILLRRGQYYDYAPPDNPSKGLSDVNVRVGLWGPVGDGLAIFDSRVAPIEIKQSISTEQTVVFDGIAFTGEFDPTTGYGARSVAISITERDNVTVRNCALFNVEAGIKSIQGDATLDTFRKIGIWNCDLGRHEDYSFYIVNPMYFLARGFRAQQNPLAINGNEAKILNYQGVRNFPDHFLRLSAPQTAVISQWVGFSSTGWSAGATSTDTSVSVIRAHQGIRFGAEHGDAMNLLLNCFLMEGAGINVDGGGDGRVYGAAFMAINMFYILATANGNARFNIGHSGLWVNRFILTAPSAPVEGTQAHRLVQFNKGAGLRPTNNWRDKGFQFSNFTLAHMLTETDMTLSYDRPLSTRFVDPEISLTNFPSEPLPPFEVSDYLFWSPNYRFSDQAGPMVPDGIFAGGTMPYRAQYWGHRQQRTDGTYILDASHGTAPDAAIIPMLSAGSTLRNSGVAVDVACDMFGTPMSATPGAVEASIAR